MKRIPTFEERKKQKHNRKLIISLLIFLLILILSLIVFDSNAQTLVSADSTGLPGDHFNLNAAAEVFKNCNSPEDFEKKLNSKSSGVNNLDLNGDKRCDYIKVIDCTQAGVHALVLRVDVNENESQDLAVFEIEKTAINKAHLQIVGMSEIYGKQKIVEPEIEKQIFEDEMWEGNSEHEKGPKNFRFEEGNFDLYCNVWYWPCVQFIYSPAYVVWISPYFWNYYPVWWDPWIPFSWQMYHQTCLPYGMYYKEVYIHDTRQAHNIYLPRKQTSGFIYRNYENSREHFIKRENERIILPEKTNNNRETESDKENNRNIQRHKNLERSVHPKRETQKNEIRNRKRK